MEKGEIKNNIVEFKPKEVEKTSICEWEEISTTDTNFVKLINQQRVKKYGDFSVFLKIISYNRNSKNSLKILGSHSKLISSGLKINQLDDDVFSFGICPFVKDNDEKVKMAFFYDKEDISTENFYEELQQTVNLSNKIIEGLGSENFIPSLPPLEK